MWLHNSEYTKNHWSGWYSYLWTLFYCCSEYRKVRYQLWCWFSPSTLLETGSVAAHCCICQASRSSHLTAEGLGLQTHATASSWTQALTLAQHFTHSQLPGPALYHFNEWCEYYVNYILIKLSKEQELPMKKSWFKAQTRVPFSLHLSYESWHLPASTLFAQPDREV